MHRQTSRFVERKDRLVFVENVELERHHGLLERRANEDHHLAGLDTLARAAAASVVPERAGFHDLLGASAGESRDAMLDEAVEALSRVLRGNGEGQQDAAGIAAGRQWDPRSSTRP